MKKIKCHLLAVCVTYLLFSTHLLAQNLVKQIQLSDFDLQSSAVITEDGSSLSTTQYQSKNYWYPVKVPSTVLTGLVANKSLSRSIYWNE